MLTGMRIILPALMQAAKITKKASGLTFKKQYNQSSFRDEFLGTKTTF